MHYFVTGASGWVGSAVVRELLAAGHLVSGLARSDASAQAIKSAGATVVRGSLHDVESLAIGASNSDGVIHLGFIHDFSNYAASCATDEAAITAMGRALAGTNKPLVVTSGTFSVADGTGRVAVESDTADTGFPRKSEAAAMALVPTGVRASVIRLPPTVHGDGDKAFIPLLIKIAREKGASVYVGDGLNHWPAVHVEDAARVFVAALTKGKAGAVYHAVGDEGVQIIKIAAVIGKHLGLPVVSKAAGDDAFAHFGFLARLISVDNRVSGERTQRELEVTPRECGLIEDLKLGHYFEAGRSTFLDL